MQKNLNSEVTKFYSVGEREKAPEMAWVSTVVGFTSDFTFPYLNWSL